MQAHLTDMQADETMINAIKDITVSEGIDPAEAVVVAGGGAAGLGIVPIAQELGCQAVIIPRTASDLSACGMQFSDIQFEQSATVPTRSDRFSQEAVNGGLDIIDTELDAFATQLAARGFTDRATQYRVEAHYAAQVWDIAVDLPAARLVTEAQVAALIEAFHVKHGRIFSIDDRASPIEFINWVGRLSVRLPQAQATAMLATGHGISEQARRPAWFDVDDRRNAAVVRGDTIGHDEKICGPAIIEEVTTTVVLPHGTSARLSSAGNYLVDLDRA